MEQVGAAAVPRQLAGSPATGWCSSISSSANQDLQLYVSPVNWRPASRRRCRSRRRPPSRRTSTSGSAPTARSAGPRRPGRSTRTGSTSRPFMDDLYRAFDDRAQVILHRDGRADVGTCSWGSSRRTDRVQHMLWRLIDPQHPMYDPALAAQLRRLDRAGLPPRRRASSARCSTRIGPRTAVMVLSDHGFHSFRTAVNLNTWLVDNGYMALAGPGARRRRTLNDLFGGGGQFWESVDWTRTRAYARRPRPDLLQPEGTRGAGHRQRRRRLPRAWPDELSRQAADDDRPADRRARRHRRSTSATTSTPGRT